MQVTQMSWAQLLSCVASLLEKVHDEMGNEDEIAQDVGQILDGLMEYPGTNVAILKWASSLMTDRLRSQIAVLVQRSTDFTSLTCCKWARAWWCQVT